MLNKPGCEMIATPDEDLEKWQRKTLSPAVSHTADAELVVASLDVVVIRY